jgi:peptidoglycan/LPS O-acetylase OafA/YrhL
MIFRSDINGLRAIAVLAVVLFHFGVVGVQGRFVGVDVFFVISGYLMTRIIFQGIERQQFSLLGFYLDRGRRIIPALALLCLAVLVMGWFLLLPADYMTLARHAISSITFSSNVRFFHEAGYFDTSSRGNWLLHTWSLSVEWQFYLLYPVVVLALRKYVKVGWIRWALAIATLLSLALSVYMSTRWPSAAFYLLPTRAWEMLTWRTGFLISHQTVEQTLSISDGVSGFRFNRFEYGYIYLTSYLAELFGGSSCCRYGIGHYVVKNKLLYNRKLCCSIYR